MNAPAKRPKPAPRGKPARDPDGSGPVSDEMFTPPNILELVRRVGPIVVDPCTTLENPTGARVIGVRRLTSDVMGFAHGAKGLIVVNDGLNERFSWAAHVRELGGLVFANWPYSTNTPWATRCRTESLAGAEVIGLCMSSTAEAWFQTHCAPRRSAAACFLAGRQRFIHGGKILGHARFGSACIYWGPRRYHFADAFAAAGSIWI